MKILILDSTGVDWTDEKLKNINGIEVDAVYKQYNVFFRVLRRLHFITSLPFKSVWYASWKKDISKYDIIIIFSALLGNEVFTWIRKNGFLGKIILYYRDPISAKYLKESCKPNVIKAENKDVELWTFDQDDADKYHMKYNPQFYFFVDNSNTLVKYDAIYVGATHSRMKEIEDVITCLLKNKCSIKFYIKCDGNEIVKNEFRKYCIYKNKSYEEILSLNRSARAIVEINQKGQKGLTVRALEALFLNKKLITNNNSIKNMDFYNVNNIFIIGEDDVTKLKKFINTPMTLIPNSIVGKYGVEAWLNRFYDEKN